MKIIQVIQAFHLGGSEQVGINIAIGLAKKGHQSCVLTIKTPSTENSMGKEFKARLLKHNVEFHEFGGPNNRINALYCPFQLSNFFRKWQPDIVHSHAEIPDFMVSLATRFSSIRVARTIHNSVIWNAHPMMGRLCESGFRNNLIVLASDASKYCYQKLQRKYRIPETNHLTRIPYGITLAGEGPPFDRWDLIEQIRSDKRKTKFCFAGRFTPQKGFDVLLDALEKIPSSYGERYHIHAFGDGEEKDQYIKRVAEKRLHVTFHPSFAGLQEVLPEFDAVIIPSRFEGFSLVSIEAMAMGVPVIGARAPGLLETYPLDWPLTVPVENSAALSRLLIQFIEGAFDIKQLKRIAKTRGEQFTISRMVDAHEKAYQDYLNPSPITSACGHPQFQAQPMEKSLAQ